MADEPYDPGVNSTTVSQGDGNTTTPYDPGVTSRGITSPPSEEATSFLDRAWHRITGPPQPVINPAPGSNIEKVRQAFSDTLEGMTYPSITRPYERSPLTPEHQQTAGPVSNFFNDTMGTAVGPLVALGSSVATLGNETLRSLGLPDSLIRDVNLEATRRAGEVPPLPATGPIRPVDRPAMQELMAPPTPSLPELLQRQQQAQTAPAIKPTDIPPAPKPFTLTPGPTPQPSQPGGLLNVSLQPQQPPSRGGLLGPPLSADEMLAQSQAHFAPVDAQIRQGATIPADAADAVRKPLVDQIPTDPQKGIAVGETPLTKLGTDYQSYQGQPMTYDAAVALDRRLTAERQAAAAQKGGADLARQIGEVQDKVRESMDNVPDPGGGDASALAQAKLGRQSYLQYRKQSQLEDIEYDASLLSEDKRDAYRRSRITTMLRNDNKMRGWFPDERAALEAQLKAGNIGSLTNWGLSTIRPVSQAIGGTIGGKVGGPVGAIIGGGIGGELGTSLASNARRRLGGLDLGPVSQRLTTNMPPPPAGWSP